jgi:histone H2A
LSIIFQTSIRLDHSSANNQRVRKQKLEQRKESKATMSGKGKSGKSGKAKRPQTSRSERAGLVFPVGRIHRYMKDAHLVEQIRGGAPVYMAAVLEYLTAEVLELAGYAAKDNKKHRIIPRHLQLAVGNDEEFRKLFEGVVISQGGVLPHINTALLPVATDQRK